MFRAITRQVDSTTRIGLLSGHLVQGLFRNVRLQGEGFRGSHLGWARLSKADSMVATEIKLGSGQDGPGPLVLFCVIAPSAPTGCSRPTPASECLSFGWTRGLWPWAQQAVEDS